MALTFGAATSDRVALAAGLNNENAFTCLAWVYKTADTNGRRFWHKGPANAKTWFLGFNAAGDDFSVYIDRATTDSDVGAAVGTLPSNEWSIIAVSFDTTDDARLFKGSLTATIAETSYAFRNLGAGAPVDDSSVAHIIGNDNVLDKAFPGRIAIFAHFKRRLTLQEIIAWQYRPYVDADCDIFMQLGFNSTGTQPNLTSLGNGINGTVTGATVGDHVPLALARSDPWMPPFVGPVALGLAVSGVGSVSPALTAQESLAASIVGQGSLSAGLSLTEALNLAAAGIGTLTADLTTGNQVVLATAIAGQAAVGSDLAITRALEAVIAGTALISPALNSPAALNAVIAGGGVLVATLTIEGQEVAVVVQDGVYSLYSYTY